MQSFRTELENPVVEKDIIDLEKKILLFKEGKIDEEKFRSLRLARGVYGQRQAGVQMIRIKIPYGRVTTKQLRRIADLSDEYASSTLHATTRQDIQIHYVSLDKTPELWAKLEQDNITLREACGNTVRNVTASAHAGIDPQEPFDVSPYAQQTFEYFLRNPICQEMGRKFKISFSSSESDSAFSFIHDVGVIPKVKVENGEEKRGFKVLVGGGLGAQPFLAEPVHEFLPEDQLIPFIEAVLRVFDRYGERARRHKARLKFLVQEVGIEGFMELVQNERKAITNKSFSIDRDKVGQPAPNKNTDFPQIEIEDKDAYQTWLDTNVFEQKQKGFYGVWVKLPLGNLTSDKARAFANVVNQYAADDIRISVNQGYLLKYLRKEALPHLYLALKELDLAAAGFDSTADVTACPGTDTCNLGISSSTGIALELENVIRNEYPDLVHNQDIKIKISGCPNSCGQHTIAAVGFHGSSIKNKGLVLPALQVLLGGGVDKDGNGRVSEKVIKVPSKRGPEVLRQVLADFEANQLDGEYFNDYYRRQGKMYFYQLLKPLASLESLNQEHYLDWGSDQTFEVIKAVGECAGVIIDLVQTLIYETDEKYGWAEEALAQNAYADAIYHSYNTFINGAKALLLGKAAKTNTSMKVIKEFDKYYVETSEFALEGSFEALVLQINQNEPTEEFAKSYMTQAKQFLDSIKKLRNEQIKQEELVA